MIRPVHLVVWAAVAVLAGMAAMFGPLGFGVAALLEAVVAMSWAVALVRSDDGRP